MKKTIHIFFFFFCLSANSFSQKAETTRSEIHPIDAKFCKSSFQTIYIGKKNTEENLKTFLKREIKNLNPENTSLSLHKKIESLAGIHFTFEQFYNGKKIFRAQIKVNMDKTGNIKSIFDNSVEIIENSNDFTPLEKVFSQINIHEIADDFKSEFIFFPDKKHLIPALHFEIVKNDDYYEIIYDSEGKIIYRNNLALFFKPQKDSTVTGNIFLPDPLTTANVIYGSPYIDSSDNDSPELNAELKQINFIADFDTSANLFRLQNSFVKINEHSLPNIPPVTSTTDDFSFTRSQNGFEDVNVFFHLSNFHNYLKSLGFVNLMNYQILADVHALSGQDQSNFVSFFNPPRLNFGEGGVDDAEDADVIIHEYGHAISHDAAPNSNFGSERTALDEALGDYFASSYSRSINSYKWENVFSWDGHNEFWPGRMSATTDHYPENLQNNLYEDADIWSSTMMEIWEDIGKENADKLQIQALYGYASNMKMSDAALLVIQADSALNNGAFYEQICNRFYNRGLMNVCETGIKENHSENKFITLINSDFFQTENGFAVLKFNKITKAEIQLFDVAGKIIYSDEIFSDEYKIESKNLAKGIYFLTVISTEFSSAFKLVK